MKEGGSKLQWERMHPAEQVIALWSQGTRVPSRGNSSAKSLKHRMFRHVLGKSRRPVCDSLQA